MKRAILLLLVCLLAGVVMAQRSGTQHWRSRAELEAFVRISAPIAEGQSRTLGAGVLIDVDSLSEDIFLVTARHLVAGRDSVLLDFSDYVADPAGQIILRQRTFQLALIPEELFMPSSQDSDFAVIAIPRSLEGIGLKAIPLSRVTEFDKLSLGQNVRFLGLPSYDFYRLLSEQWNFPIVRGGVTAFFANQEYWLAPDTMGDSTRLLIPGMFLVDGVSMGGNSGGPLFLVEQYVDNSEISSTPRRVPQVVSLAGIVVGHLRAPYRIDLSGFRLLSVLTDSIHTTADSLRAVRVLDSLYVIGFENADLAKVVSLSLVLEFLLPLLNDSAAGWDN